MITEINPYIALVAMMVFVTGFVLTLLFLSVKVGPKFTSRAKEIPFECGGNPVGEVKEQRFNVKYYLVAMIFILFDLEVIFMYPWAVNAEFLGWNGLVALTSFMFVLALGLIYVWKKGALNWNE